MPTDTEILQEIASRATAAKKSPKSLGDLAKSVLSQSTTVTEAEYLERQRIETKKLQESQILGMIQQSGLRVRELNLIANGFNSTSKKWSHYQQAIESKLGAGVVIGLLGERGTGKTLAAAVAAHKACLKLRSVRYSSALEFYIDIRDTYGDTASKREKAVIGEYCRPSLLVLDEVHERGESAWEDRMLTHMVDRRYSEMKDTILIANQTPEEFEAGVGPSIVDRAREGGAIFVYGWESFRGQVKT